MRCATLASMALAGLTFGSYPHPVHAQCWPGDGIVLPCCPSFAPPCFAPFPFLPPAPSAQPSPRPGSAQGPGPVERPATAQGRRVHVLLLGLTGDEEIGAGAKKDLARMKETLEAGIPAAQRGGIRVLSGDDMTAANILAQVDRMEVQPGDTLLCYYSGQGTYDPARAAGDPSGGHSFYIPSGDLLRKDLLARLRAKRARLTVLISDTCNGRSFVRAKLPATPLEPPRRNPILTSLLLGHEGLVDVNGSSPDESGWSSATTGGWYTEALLSVLCDPKRFDDPQAARWGDALSEAFSATAKLYRERKEQILAHPEGVDKATLNALKNQATQRQRTFQLKVDRVPGKDASAAPARIVVRAEEGARLFIDGKLTQQRGATRRFVTPALPAGTTVYYAARLEPAPGGEGTEQSRRIAVRAGETTEVDLTPAPAARRLPQPPGGSWVVPTFSVGETITVNAKGRQPEQCRVQASWAEPNGTRILQVRSLSTGETITVIPRAQPGLFRAYHWGPSNKPPPGVPTPPDSRAARTNAPPTPGGPVALAGSL